MFIKGNQVEQQTEPQEKIDVVISVLDYLHQIEANRHIIEKHYFNQDTSGYKTQMIALLNGLAWIEYAVVLLDMNMNADDKNRFFEGVREAIEVEDWITVIDFLSYPIVQYIELMRDAFTQKYTDLTGERYERLA